MYTCKPSQPRAPLFPLPSLRLSSSLNNFSAARTMLSISPNLPDTCPTCGSLTKTTFSDHPRSSRVSELLRCNDPPSDSELSDFQSIVKSGSGHIADLDKKIACAKKHLTALIQERNVLAANIGDARTLSSPIRRLPSDVLRDIALATIPSRYQVMNFHFQKP
ncbi:hypothetical protein IW262DRAFT_1493150 [Armillaria fumosa]|nr:hypothetical protein IW262DRAFT_1493150 [Armillaria fumosa]